MLGALSICLPSLVSIAISHSAAGFFGFRERGYDPDALVSVVAEIGAVVFALIGAAVAGAASHPTTVARGRRRARRWRRSSHRDRLRDHRDRHPLGARRGRARCGIGIRSAPAEGEPAAGAAAVAASRERIAAAGAAGRRGRVLFAEQGCDRYHSIAAIGASGMSAIIRREMCAVWEHDPRLAVDIGVGSTWMGRSEP